MMQILLIGGSDNSGGAGVFADMETVYGLGAKPTFAITAITAQSDHLFFHNHTVPSKTLKAQLQATEMNQVGAIKIGMLPNKESIGVVSEFLSEHSEIPSVLDPVFTSSSGGTLSSYEGIASLGSQLFPLINIITPNILEACRLTKLGCVRKEDLETLAHACRKMGANAVLVKGGHLPGNHCVDFLLSKDRGNCFFERKRIPGGTEVRGTGCRLASAIAYHLAMGYNIMESVDRSRRYLSSYIEERVQGI